MIGPFEIDVSPPHTVENLQLLIAAVDLLRAELGFSRWSELVKFCDCGDPLTTDGDGLELLFERLVVKWADGLDPSWPIDGLNQQTGTQLNLLNSRSHPPTERAPVYLGLMPSQQDL